jgi:hypothetical protein
MDAEGYCLLTPQPTRPRHLGARSYGLTLRCRIVRLSAAESGILSQQVSLIHFDSEVVL